MSRDLVSNSFWNFPALRVPSFFEDDDDFWTATTNIPSGLAISEDDKNVYVEASVPGIDPKDIEVTFDKGILWVKGETKQEDKGKKYYRRAMNSFSYRVAVPGELDLNTEPEAECENGVMKITFTKSPKSLPKKIAVKSKSSK